MLQPRSIIFSASLGVITLVMAAGTHQLRADDDAQGAPPGYHYKTVMVGGKPIRVFVDPKSFLYLAGMVLDFEETLMRQGFNFINPNSTKSCGCGTSFSA